MPHLALFFLGPPRIELDNTPCEISLRKATALLANIAVSPMSQTRETLAMMFWPEASKGRRQLRYALWTLRTELGPTWFCLSGDNVGLNPDAHVTVDVIQFQSLLAKAGLPQQAGHVDLDNLPLLEEAVNLYRGDFLDGFTLRDCEGFDEWQSMCTEAYRQDLALALECLVIGLTQIAAYTRAIPFAHRWVALDPLREPAHRGLMQVLALSGHRADALRQYEACVDFLRTEMGLEPGQRTQNLYRAILTRDFPAKSESIF